MSAYHKWNIYWEDKNETFWMYSGDIGTHLWLPNSDGIYKQEDMKPEFVKNIPNEYTHLYNRWK